MKTMMNTKSRTNNSLRNVSSGLLSQVIQTILGFISRTLFVKFLAIEYLGVNGLFSSILSVLSLTELGIGSAFVYALYKPISENNTSQISAILQLYKKVYLTIGSIIFIVGLLLIPFLDILIPEKPTAIAESITVIYLVFLFNTASSYFFSYKVALINADQRNSVTTYNYLIFYIIQNVIQILVLIFFQDFLLFLGVQLVLQFLSNVSISILTDKYYPFLKKHKNEPIDPQIKAQIISNTKASMVTKIGGVVVNHTDNLIINYFSGLALVGLASNYNLLIAIATAMIIQIFNNLTASLAQVNTKESKEKQFEVFKSINLVNMWIYGLVAVLFILVANDFIHLWLGDSFLLPSNISILLAINFFMVGVQGTIWTFKSTYGFFHEGKYLVLLTALLNIIFSFWLGSSWGLLGILTATAIARVTTNFWYDAYVVFKKGLLINHSFYYWRLSKFILAIIIPTTILYFAYNTYSFGPLINIIYKGITAFIVINMTLIIIYKNTEEYQRLKALAEGVITSIVQKLKRPKTA